ncbi:MAG: hypothetical protein IPJ47_10005 [Anaerolineales bacterium]|nr:hypothetical protein [Anaerolineales bacterium]
MNDKVHITTGFVTGLTHHLGADIHGTRHQLFKKNDLGPCDIKPRDKGKNGWTSPREPR